MQMNWQRLQIKFIQWIFYSWLPLQMSRLTLTVLRKFFKCLLKKLRPHRPRSRSTQVSSRSSTCNRHGVSWNHKQFESKAFKCMKPCKISLVSISRFIGRTILYLKSGNWGSGNFQPPRCYRHFTWYWRRFIFYST